MSKIQTVIYLEPEIKDQLQITAIKTKSSMTEIIEELVKEYLNNTPNLKK